MPGNMSTDTPREMIDGPAIRPPEPLLRWLAANAKLPSGGRRRFRLPVVVFFADDYRLELGGAFIGVSGDRPGPDAVELLLDTAALGIPLSESLLAGFPQGTLACPVWLDGYWEPAAESPDGSGKPRFVVMHLHGRIDARTQKRGGRVRALAEQVR